jgi:hypothetical protein
VSELRQVFSGAKTVDSPTLNRLGAQPARAVLARVLYRLRSAPRDPVTAELTRSGVAVWPDFLPPDTFDAAVRESEEYAATTLPRWLHQYGASLLSTYSLRDADPARFPNLTAWPAQERVLELSRNAERRPLTWKKGAPLLEHLCHGDTTERDPQTVLHVDTFFNTHKVWLYLDDVTEQNGALVYVPGSHVLDAVRLREEYRATTTPDGCPEPSRRVSDREVERRGQARRVISAPRNTLVIANTCGYHCRSVGEPGTFRRALHMAFRFDPFRYPTPNASRALRAARRVGRRT